MRAGGGRHEAGPTLPPEPYDGVREAKATFQGRAPRAAEFYELALADAERAGATIVQRGGTLAGVSIDAPVRGRNGTVFVVLAHGYIATVPGGLGRTHTVRKAGDSHSSWPRTPTRPRC